MKDINSSEFRPGARSPAVMAIAALAFLASPTSTILANSGGVTIQEGPWIHEDDFDADPTLHKVDGMGPSI